MTHSRTIDPAVRLGTAAGTVATSTAEHKQNQNGHARTTAPDGKTISPGALVGVRIALVLILLSFSLTPLFAGGSVEEVEPQENEDGYRVVETEEFTFAWRVSGDNLDVRMSAPTTGWVSVGFDPTRAMRDADMKFGFVSNGSAEMADHFGTSAIQHDFDTEIGGSRDLRNVSGTEADGRTTLSFTMPLDSGDEYDAALASGQEHVIIYAHGGDGVDDYSTKHVARGGFKIQL